jgi:spore maturation protein CgeB
MAMACGACNLTNVVLGLLELFEDRKHLVTYEPETLLDTVDGLLEDGGRVERIAAEGCKEALYRHTWRQRAGG